MRVHLINPSHVTFGVAVITPRWLYVLAAATGTAWGDPLIVDETIEHVDPESIAAGRRRRHRDSHRQRAAWLRSRTPARERGAWVVFGGIHATLFPGRSRQSSGGAHSVVKRRRRRDVGQGRRRTASMDIPSRSTTRGRIAGDAVRLGALGSLLPEARLHVGVGPDRARLPEALLVLLGVADRRPGAASARTSIAVVHEIVELRRLGFRFIALADDNFYPVTFEDLAAARRRSDRVAPARARGAAAGALRR